MGSTPMKDQNLKMATKELKMLHFFLFNDMLLITRFKKPNFEPKFQMMIETTTVVKNGKNHF
jgi:hypothetical protein